MHFITSSYGNSYSALLAVFLASVRKNCASSTVTVYWQDMADDIISALQATFANFFFKKTNYSIRDSLHKKISSKMLLWQQAFEESSDEEMCLIDSDTVVQHVPDDFLDGYDCIFTDKNEQFHLNTGVVLIRKTPAAREFLRLWTERTIEIVESAPLLEEAVSPQNHYGGADQMALYQLIDYTLARKEYRLINAQGGLALKALPCAVLNETNSVPLSPSIYVYHYKGGWRDVLLKGLHSPYRTRKACWPMHRQYLELYRECRGLMRKARVPEETIDKIRLHVPPYFSMNDGRFSCAKLWFEIAKDALRHWRNT